MPSSAPNPLGIYLSIPFCKSKCSYCNFASGVFGSDRMSAYVDRLIQEIRASDPRTQQCSAFLSSTVDSLYFGGGTPSLLSPQQMHRILQAIQEAFSFAPQTEMTLECAPGQLNDALLESLPSVGFNRASLGVQSFVDQECAAVGRLHTRAITAAQIASLRTAGIDDINVDLIAGLPHQTPESWQISVAEAIATGVSHLSVYMLDVDEDSRLGREMLAGGTRYHAANVPGESAIAEMYAHACESFAAAGIAQYEISNFARPGRESRHNLKYWTRQPYLGFGLDAHSFLNTQNGGEIRINTTDDLTAYMDRTAPETIVPISNTEAIEEAWFLGLRLSAGIFLPAMEHKIGPEAMSAFRPVLEECQQQGLLECIDDHVRLTSHGRLFANEVFARFIGVLSVEGVSA
ncbi:MAG TPA: radical SAM family heme chaperone HemW [Acidobacteriaceae bacterium]|nr:radical SAM family heme chaperone HemW [Acidobacteriaceae bacterium]